MLLYTIGLKKKQFLARNPRPFTNLRAWGSAAYLRWSEAPSGARNPRKIVFYIMNSRNSITNTELIRQVIHI
jgi:hypothetical protein